MKKPARYAAVMGLLLALSAALNYADSLFSAFLPAGMRVGLSNIVIMAAILCLDLPAALTLTVLKSGFVLLTRGVTAGVLSLCGGLAAFAVTGVLFRKTKASYVLISVLGAAAHSFGQLCGAAIIMGTSLVYAYAPLLGLSSLGAGIVTGIVLKTVFPALEKVLKGNGTGGEPPRV